MYNEGIFLLRFIFSFSKTYYIINYEFQIEIPFQTYKYLRLLFCISKRKKQFVHYIRWAHFSSCQLLFHLSIKQKIFETLQIQNLTEIMKTTIFFF